MYGTSRRAQRQNSCVVRGVCTARQEEHCDRTPVLYEVYVLHVKKSTVTELLFCTRCMYGTSSRAQRQNSCVVRGVCTARQEEHCDRTPVLYEVYVLHVKKSTVTELLFCTRCVCTARQAEHRDRTPVLYEVNVRHVKQSTELQCCTQLRTQPSVADVVPNPLLGEVCGCGDDKIQNSVGTSSKFWVWGGEGAKT
ncbi:hypothetical protein RRG08_067072 [Elysia crispata]|uniref:Uncharacterized protein n=1 Tax=Elysia crispata TaxID=231223 RepID=A0AAE1EB95_9GAST|nr:hypothetical protein RRG08_067072 [Elysia crispata]